jgi:hypothetical protein
LAVGGAGSQEPIVDAIALQVHQFAAGPARPKLDAGRHSAELRLNVEIADPRHHARIAPDAHLHAARATSWSASTIAPMVALAVGGIQYRFRCSSFRRDRYGRLRLRPRQYAGYAPRVILRATHEGALDHCSLADLKRFALDLA